MDKLINVDRVYDRETGVCVFEAHFVGNALHRHDNPAWIERDRKSGIQISEWWYTDGRRHRQDGPAVVERDGQTGEISLQEWWKEGELIDSLVQPKRNLLGMQGPSI